VCGPRLFRNGLDDALRETRVTVIAGAAVVDRQGYDNVLIEIAAGRRASSTTNECPAGLDVAALAVVDRPGRQRGGALFLRQFRS